MDFGLSDEQVLLDQDRFISACLLRPEFQRAMTGTEMRAPVPGPRFDCRMSGLPGS